MSSAGPDDTFHSFSLFCRQLGRTAFLIHFFLFRRQLGRATLSVLTFHSCFRRQLGRATPFVLFPFSFMFSLSAGPGNAFDSHFITCFIVSWAGRCFCVLSLHLINIHCLEACSSGRNLDYILLFMTNAFD